MPNLPSDVRKQMAGRLMTDEEKFRFDLTGSVTLST